MTNLFNIGLSALNASQRQLSTTGHNIANVNTDGFSRQRVEQAPRPPQFTGAGFVGKGVVIDRIERLANDFLTTQMRTSTTNEAQANTYLRLSSLVDTLLGDGTFSQTLEGFSSAMQDAADDPSSIPARSILINSAESLVARFADIDTNLSTIALNVNDEITAAVNEINTLSTAIAELNLDIVYAYGSTHGEPPNDLLDQRDTLVRQLATVTGVSTSEQSDGAINVFIGSGQSVVQSGNAIPLTTIRNPLDGSQLEVAYNVNGVTSSISNLLQTGELGAALEFRNDLIEPSRNAMGRIAATIAVTVNEQHREGMDLNGQLGGDLFTVAPPRVNPLSGNVGDVAVTINNTDINNLTTADYRLTHNGTDFELLNLQTNSTQTLSGAGPFNVDGFTINVTSPPVAGDRYLIQPTKTAAQNLSVAVSDPNKVALALPVRAEGDLTNISDATISADQILDVTDPQLLVSTQIVFADPPTSFQINGVGPLLPYTDGADIDLNGWRVQISGSPEPGDTFTVSANTGGQGDNTNGLALGSLLQTKFIDGGSATYQEAFGQLVSSVGSRTRQTQISLQALSTLRENAEDARNSLSAVNLDEEAANLIRFQQSYQAAAQVISAGNDMFQSLLGAIRR